MARAILTSGVLFLILLGPGLCIYAVWNTYIWPRKYSHFSVVRGMVIAFVLTIAGHGFAAWLFSLLSVDFEHIHWLWLSSWALLGWFLFSKRYAVPSFLSSIRPDGQGWAMLLLTVVLALIMALQGGLLDMIADGWWHMAYANRIRIENMPFISVHPLVGESFGRPTILYPPLWHINLALISDGTGMALPQIWHAIAAPITIFTMSAFYLLCSRLTKCRTTILLAMLLFTLLIGGLNSYWRVTPWPANVAYVILYFLISETLLFADRLQASHPGPALRDLLELGHLTSIAFLFFLGLVLLGLHGVEVMLFLFALLAYFTSTVLSSATARSTVLCTDRFVTGWLLAGMLVGGASVATIFLYDYYQDLFSTPRAHAPYLNFLIPLFCAVLIIAYAYCKQSALHWLRRFRPFLSWSIMTALVLVLLSTIDYIHVAELFFPTSHGRHVPRAFFDAFDNRVWLPWWDHQLRGAMLFSGLIGISCSIYNVIRQVDRGTMFLASTSIFASLILVSPYFFTFTSFLIPLSSAYRVHLLILVPLSIAMFFVSIYPREFIKKLLAA